jgi:hypothetical protein
MIDDPHENSEAMTFEEIPGKQAAIKIDVMRIIFIFPHIAPSQIIRTLLKISPKDR